MKIKSKNSNNQSGGKNMINREIKFRAWDLDRKKMRGVQGFRINVDGCKTWNCTENPNNWEPRVTDHPKHTGAIIMQFTGLKDKNGKEIYEGDIVRFYHDEEGWNNGFIKFEHGAFIIACDNLPDSYDLLVNYSNSESWTDNLNVVGNIYENPESLSKEGEKGK